MDYHDPEWASERLGLDKNTLYKFLNEGRIPAIQLGRKWLISEARLVRWLEEETERQTAARRHSVKAVDRAIDKMRQLNSASRAILRDAFALARQLGHRHLGLEHLFGVLIDAKMEQGELLPRELRAEIEPFEAKPQSSAENLQSSPIKFGRKPAARRAMRLAVEEAGRAGAKLVDPLHLLLGVLRAAEPAGIRLSEASFIPRETIRKWIDRLNTIRKENP